MIYNCRCRCRLPRLVTYSARSGRLRLANRLLGWVGKRCTVISVLEARPGQEEYLPPGIPLGFALSTARTLDMSGTYQVYWPPSRDVDSWTHYPVEGPSARWIDNLKSMVQTGCRRQGLEAVAHFRRRHVQVDDKVNDQVIWINNGYPAFPENIIRVLLLLWL